jgi:FkbM family methyltransferase
MYDASDTIYYLEEGYDVVAVEANPALVKRAEILLRKPLETDRLKIVNAAITKSNKDVRLTICGDDLGSSSTFSEKVASRFPLGDYIVPGIRPEDIFERYGVPFYLKIDLEGADEICISALTPKTKPPYLSFEVEDDVEQHIRHLAAIGFSRFKLINQCTFREWSRRRNLRDRVKHRLLKAMGFAEPQYVRRRGRLFRLGASSGPVPWCSDGSWCSETDLVRKWAMVQGSERKNEWYDIHAT